MEYVAGRRDDDSVTDSSDISRDLTILGFAIVLVINVRGRSDAAGLLGQTAKWSVRQVAPIVAFDALGTPAVSQVLHQLLLWIPNLVVAFVMLALAPGYPLLSAGVTPLELSRSVARSPRLSDSKP